VKEQLEYVFVEIINASREVVWEALTSPAFTEQYWHSTRVASDFRPGSEIVFHVDGGEVGCRGEVLAADPPALLAYTWQFPRNPVVRDEVPSRVTFELETIGTAATGQATRLTVTHDRFPEGSHMPELVRPGWPLVIAGLKTLLETGEAVDYSSMT
jgi:uncharacterized protein YndB with AHSA1/START domain